MECGIIEVTGRNNRYSGKTYLLYGLVPCLYAADHVYDCSGEYRGTDKNIYGDPGFTNYTVFSLWDTYRAAHPLYTLVQPERVPDFINSMLAIYEQQGRLPVWHLYGRIRMR